MNRDFEHLSGDEMELIRIFRQLNSEGKESLLSQAMMHSHVPVLQKWWRTQGKVTYIDRQSEKGQVGE